MGVAWLIRLHVRDLSTCAVQTTVACRTGEFRERNAFCFRLVLRARVSRFAVCSANPPFLQADFQGSFLRTEYLIPVFHSPFSLKPLILWSPKMAASKSTTQTSVFMIIKLAYVLFSWQRA